MIESAEEFVRLRRSEVLEEYSLAAHGEAPVAVWLDVIARFPDMRSWVAHNKSVPLEILEVLARDDDADVRFTVAMKRKLSAALFESLSQDADDSVRHGIACNAKVPASVLKRLATDPAEFVRTTAQKRLLEHPSGQA